MDYPCFPSTYHLSPISVAPKRILDQLANFWNGAQQVLSVKDCNLPINDIFGGTQLYKLHSLAVGPSNLFGLATREVGRVSSQLLHRHPHTTTGNCVTQKYQSLEHWTASLRMMGGRFAARDQGWTGV